MVYDGGALIAADSRTSSSVYVANRIADKIWPIAKNIYSAKAGTSSDTQFLLQSAKNYIGQFAVEYNDKPPVKVAARILQQFQYEYKNYLSATLIVGGVDNFEGPCIYSVGMGGTTLKQDIALNGSGSVFIQGYIDKYFKKNMTKQEAKEFLKNAISMAIHKDTSSGGIIRMVDITKEGATREYISYNEIKAIKLK